MPRSTIKDLVGKTMSSVTEDGDTMTFKTTCGRTFQFYHGQDCCESVSINDINGDLNDLVGSPILMAEEVSGDETGLDGGNDSFTWTFYKFATLKGYVDVRWLGTSNGYYSESVDFHEIT